MGRRKPIKIALKSLKGELYIESFLNSNKLTETNRNRLTVRFAYFTFKGFSRQRGKPLQRPGYRINLKTRFTLKRPDIVDGDNVDFHI